MLDEDGVLGVGEGAREILIVDRVNKTIKLSGSNVETAAGGSDILAISGSYGLELTGLGSIFASTGPLYGIDRALNKWLVPTIIGTVGVISDIKMKKGLHEASIIADSEPNFLLTSHGVERSYYEYLETTKRNINTMALKGGGQLSFDNALELILP